ncbi:MULTISPECIES: hypothetical protein [Streptomyces]|nr:MULTISPECIES: hypothetical protein [Streptomyces]
MGNVGNKVRRAGDSGGTIAAVSVIALIAVAVALLGLVTVRS